jgi:DNA-binding NarL/FixJ family response regulator
LTVEQVGGSNLQDQIETQNLMTYARESSQLKVVVADDSAALRERLAATLAAIEGVRVAGLASCGAEAVDAFNTTLADLFILDIQMPDGSGVDVLREIKLRNSATMVIMFTNHPYPQYQQKCVELGADHFLSKSRDFKQLIKIVEELAVSKSANPVE